MNSNWLVVGAPLLKTAKSNCVAARWPCAAYGKVMAYACAYAAMQWCTLPHTNFMPLAWAH